MTRPRDSQRSKVYTAGHAVSEGKRLETVAELQAYGGIL